MTLQGAPELHRRLKAISAIAEDRSLTREWQEAAAAQARRMVPVRTGGTRRSIKPGRTRRGKASVVGFYTVNFIDAGSKAHVEPRQRGLTKTGRVSRRKVGTGKVLQFQGRGGGTFFRKKVNKPAIHARPFKRRAAEAGVRIVKWHEFLYRLWDGAA